jgi:hypothetical protein
MEVAMKFTTIVAPLIIAGLAVASPAPGADSSTLPVPQEQGAISYITGGIGEDEAIAFKQAATSYPLELLFVQKAQPRDIGPRPVRQFAAGNNGRRSLPADKITARKIQD